MSGKERGKGMRIRKCALMLGPLVAAGLLMGQGQKKPEPLTYVALFQVEMKNIGGFIDKAKQFTPVMDKLLADGTIRAYGLEIDHLHQTRGPNVAFWYTAPNYTNLDKAETAVNEFIGKSPELMGEMSTLHDTSKHIDLLVRSLESGGAKNAGCDKPLNSFSEYQVKPGKMQDFLKMFRERQKPVLDALVKDGTLCSYSFDVEDVHSMPMGRVWIITSTPDMAAWDKMDAAFEAAEAKLSASEKSIRQNTWRDAHEPSAHRDSVSKIVFMNSK